MTSTLIRPRTYNPDTAFDGYYTIEIRPITCGCGKEMKYIEADTKHIIIVWEEIDDEYLLANAAEMKRLDLNPKIVEYDASYGRCMEFYTALEKGLVSGE